MNRRIVHKEAVYEGAVAKVYRVGLKMGDGSIVSRDLIHYTGAAIILPVLADGSIILIRNYRFALDEHLCELPAGMLEEGEPPEQCARRELTEETGYVAGTIRKLGAFCTCPGTSDEIIHAYLATDLRPGRQDLETHEEISVQPVAQEKVRSMIRDGTIHDAKTIATLTLHWLGGGSL